MTRVPEFLAARRLFSQLNENRSNVNRLSSNISSGFSVYTPGDSNNAGAIAQFQSALEKAGGYKIRITEIKSSLSLQESTLEQVNDLMIRAKEIAAQAANETNSPTNRAQLAEEIFQIRDHLVSLANTQRQGKFIYGGTDDDDAPYDAATYPVPATGEASVRYVYDSDPGASGRRTVNITENLSITTNTPGSELFDQGLQALERLGRALSGYSTTPPLALPDTIPAPTGGAAYTFPADFGTQTADIKSAMDLLDLTRNTQIMPERIDVAGRLRRIETAESLIDLTTTSSKEALERYQATDVFKAASELTQAQTALEASLTVSGKIMQLSILNYI